MRPRWSSVYASHGRSISSGPEDWPSLALRRSDAMQRYSPLHSAIGLKGSPRVKPEIVEFSPPGDEQQREPGTGLLIMDANGAFFVEGHGSSSLPGLLSKRARRCGHRRRRGARFQYLASDRIHDVRPP